VRAGRGEVWVRMPGIHYAQNALAALCVSDVSTCLLLCIARRWHRLQGGPALFRARRGRRVLVVTTTATPTEIAATLAPRLFAGA